MASGHTRDVLHHFQDLLWPDAAGLTDGQLLDRYVRRREEAAFAALVRRHGPMVWGVCRRILGTHHDAEDAFQATFLVLVRKAASITPAGMVAPWLYGVAYRTARKARLLGARKREREIPMAKLPEPGTDVTQRDLGPDLGPVLDRELTLLPERYRLPIVLCDVEGKSYREAARDLGCPEGTLAARLARARKMLAKRLTRRGLVVSVAALPQLLGPAMAGRPPLALVTSTLGTAADSALRGAADPSVATPQVVSLTKGVLRSMSMKGLKTGVTAGILLSLSVAGVALFPYRTAAAGGGKDVDPDGIQTSIAASLERRAAATSAEALCPYCGAPQSVVPRCENCRARLVPGTERLDVVIFKYPVPQINYIKRLRGLPGETVEIQAGTMRPLGTDRPVQDFRPHDR